jgi:N-acetylneuraminate synthase
VFQCTTAYPCRRRKIGLNLIRSTASDTVLGGTVGSLGDDLPRPRGRALGMDMLEVHVALSREMFGPDVIASVTTAELRQLVTGVRFIERCARIRLTRTLSAQETAPLRKLFTRSLVASAICRPVPSSRASTSPIKKPGTGLPPERLEDIIGRRLARPVTAINAGGGRHRRTHDRAN